MSEIEIYFDVNCLDNDIDILLYWKLNSIRLVIIACNILSIPNTIVASESSFIIGVCILLKYNNCLLSESNANFNLYT